MHQFGTQQGKTKSIAILGYSIACRFDGKIDKNESDYFDVSKYFTTIAHENPETFFLISGFYVVILLPSLARALIGEDL